VQIFTSRFRGNVCCHLSIVRRSRAPRQFSLSNRGPSYAESVARYVIDAPTLLHLVDAELDVAPGHQLVAPNSIRSEALELLLHDVRAGKRTEEAALETHERMTGIKIRLLGDRVSRRTAWRLARQHDWDTLRDAEYLAVTRLQADALVTVDPSLAATARDAVAVAAIDDLLTQG
jgi:predicted nucleic acid-binding protein